MSESTGNPTDSTDHVDWTKAQKVVLPNLKPTSASQVISLRFWLNLQSVLHRKALAFRLKQ